MSNSKNKRIYTIGHSTRSLEEFIALLRENRIEVLVDVRSFPGSRKFPQFNKEALATSLPEKSIEYRHYKDLGGRRKPKENSGNSVWRNESFRGYADYMQTTAFKEALQDLKKLASAKTLVILCAEAVWWRCHRSMIADILKANGWEVLHIMGKEKITKHPYTKPAKIVGDKLTYKTD